MSSRTGFLWFTDQTGKAKLEVGGQYDHTSCRTSRMARI